MEVEKKHFQFAGKSTNIRLSPVPPEFTESDIYDWIQSLTDKTPLSIDVRRFMKNKVHRLCVYRIAFASIDDASFCASKLNRQTIPNTGFICQCSVAAPWRIAVNRNDIPRDTTIWVKLTGLSKSTTEQDIISHIQQKSGIANEPKTIRLVQHENEKYPGLAFVECANSEDATKCVDNLRLTMLCGSKIWCNWNGARKEFERKEELAGETSLILVGNLHYLVESQHLLALCGKYGEVKDVEIWFDKCRYRQGMATVTMGSNRAAVKAFEGLHGEKLKNLAVLTGYFKPAVPRPRLKKKKIAKFSAKIRDFNEAREDREFMKQLMKSKDIKKKIETEPSNAPKSDNNTDQGFAKKMRSVGRGGWRGRGRGRGGGSRGGPKLA